MLANNIFTGFLAGASKGVLTGSSGSQLERRYYGGAIVGSLFEDGGRMSARGRCNTYYKVEVNEQRVYAAKAWEPTARSEGTYKYSEGYIQRVQQVTPSRFVDGLPLAGNTYSFNSIARRLGQGLAFFSSKFGKNESAAWLLNSREMNIKEVRPEGRFYGATGVYVPICTPSRGGANITSVIMYAAAGCGADVYTNELYVTEGSWAHSLPAGNELCSAIVEAASTVIDCAEACGNGDVALASFIIGLHDVVTVVG